MANGMTTPPKQDVYHRVQQCPSSSNLMLWSGNRIYPQVQTQLPAVMNQATISGRSVPANNSTARRSHQATISSHSVPANSTARSRARSHEGDVLNLRPGLGVPPEQKSARQSSQEPSYSVPTT
eukprot:scaffold16143_cov56-Phaeocystis_antarctica.AAC.2